MIVGPKSRTLKNPPLDRYNSFHETIFKESVFGRPFHINLWKHVCSPTPEPSKGTARRTGDLSRTILVPFFLEGNRRWREMFCPWTCAWGMKCTLRILILCSLASMSTYSLVLTLLMRVGTGPRDMAPSMHAFASPLDLAEWSRAAYIDGKSGLWSTSARTSRVGICSIGII